MHWARRRSSTQKIKSVVPVLKFSPVAFFLGKDPKKTPRKFNLRWLGWIKLNSWSQEEWRPDLRCRPHKEMNQEVYSSPLVQSATQRKPTISYNPLDQYLLWNCLCPREGSVSQWKTPSGYITPRTPSRPMIPKSVLVATYGEQRGPRFCCKTSIGINANSLSGVGEAYESSVSHQY